MSNSEDEGRKVVTMVLVYKLYNVRDNSPTPKVALRKLGYVSCFYVLFTYTRFV